MKYYLDTEFYEDGKTIDLISIGIVAEDGREFYAVSREAQLHRVSAWVRENVLPSLPPYGDPAWLSRSQIASSLKDFVWERGHATPPEFWAYYADHDWVALCQLFGTMMDLPKGFPMFCRDLKQLSVDVGSPQHPPDPKDEHNALADARWNKELHAFLLATPHRPYARGRDVMATLECYGCNSTMDWEGDVPEYDSDQLCHDCIGRDRDDLLGQVSRLKLEVDGLYKALEHIASVYRDGYRNLAFDTLENLLKKHARAALGAAK